MFQKFIAACIVAAFAVFLEIVILEWLAGCGETYVDANGVRHAYQCLFVK